MTAMYIVLGTALLGVAAWIVTLIIKNYRLRDEPQTRDEHWKHTLD